MCTTTKIQLIGPNGSGKSTLLSMITGDNPKAYGQNMILFGIKKGSGETVWDIKEKIGYFSSAIGFGFSRLHSIENMIISGYHDSIGLYVKPTDLQIKLSHEWLKLIGLYEVRQRPFVMLSLAQQRLLLIVRALVKHPPLLIVDEPLAGLDDEEVSIVIALLNKIASETNITILYVSHRIEKELSPKLVYELIPSPNGSIGVVKS